MKTHRLLLRGLSGLLEYPNDGFDRVLKIVASLLDRHGFDSKFRVFQRMILRLSPGEREELFLSTLEVLPACVPYVSIHLFGEENFKRGEFMAALSGRYAQARFDSQGELPDHLAVLLRYLVLTSAEEGSELCAFCLLSPLNRMTQSLNHENPYRYLLETIEAVLVAIFPGVRAMPLPIESITGKEPCAASSHPCGCAAGIRSDPRNTAVARRSSP